MINGDSALLHLLRILVAEGVATISANIEQDDFRQKMSPFRTGLEKIESSYLTIFATYSSPK